MLVVLFVLIGFPELPGPILGSMLFISKTYRYVSTRNISRARKLCTFMLVSIIIESPWVASSVVCFIITLNNHNIQ